MRFPHSPRRFCNLRYPLCYRSLSGVLPQFGAAKLRLFCYCHKPFHFFLSRKGVNFRVVNFFGAKPGHFFPKSHSMAHEYSRLTPLIYSASRVGLQALSSVAEAGCPRRAQGFRLSPSARTGLPRPRRRKDAAFRPFAGVHLDFSRHCRKNIPSSRTKSPVHLLTQVHDSDVATG